MTDRRQNARHLLDSRPVLKKRSTRLLSFGESRPPYDIRKNMQGYRWRRRRASECLDFNRKIEQTTFPNPRTWYYLACFSSVMEPSVRDLLQCRRWTIFTSEIPKASARDLNSASVQPMQDTRWILSRRWWEHSRGIGLDFTLWQSDFANRFWLAVLAKELRELTLLGHGASCSRITRNLLFSLLLVVESLVELHDTSSKKKTMIYIMADIITCSEPNSIYSNNFHIGPLL